MVLLARFLQALRDIRALNPVYREGGSGVDGTCDCIGFIIGAIRRAGGTWTGTHGSNYAAGRLTAEEYVELVGMLRVQ